MGINRPSRRLRPAIRERRVGDSGGKDRCEKRERAKEVRKDEAEDHRTSELGREWVLIRLSKGGTT